RRLVTNSIPGLAADRVSVVFVAAQARAGGEAQAPDAPSGHVWGFEVARGAASALGALLWSLSLALVLALGGLAYVFWRYVLRPQQRAAPAAPASARTT